MPKNDFVSLINCCGNTALFDTTTLCRMTHDQVTLNVFRLMALIMMADSIMTHSVMTHCHRIQHYGIQHNDTLPSQPALRHSA
jgi:hypothetical protein